MEARRLLTVLTLQLVVLFSVSQRANAQVVINEVMAQNNSTIKDPLYGESADWVELFNNTESAVDLSGYYITDNLKTPTKYQLPEGTTIAARGFLLIWCDGNDTGLHTNFKLSADGESIGLYTPTEELQDSLTFGPQMLDVSYGRRQDDMAEWAFYSSPTPGEANTTEGYTGKANQPMILTRGGFFTGSATVAITNDLGGKVHYTTDGSVPTAESPIYQEPLTFTTTTILRARIIDEGMMPGNVMTESYFIDDAFAGHGLPVVSIATDAASFWDKEAGIYVQDFKPDWEVPVNIEMFLNNGSDRSVFNECAGIKINGLYAWQLPQKMLGVYFKKKYGESKLAYQLFFDDQRSSFDDFALRASGSDWSYTLMRDGLVQQAARQGEMNLDLMAFRPCVVYVNGEFLGIHNIREKVNEDYIKQHYGLKASEFDMVEGSANEPEVGTADAWQAFMEKAKTDNLSDDAVFEEYANSFDVENFTDYIISECYSGNTSLSHNTMMWKPHTGGKWRYILMDMDRGFFEFDSKSYLLDNVIGKSYWPLKWMLNNDGYKKYFYQRFADQLFTTYNPDEICRQINGHQADIAPLMDKHVARWLGTTSSYGDAMPSVVYWYNEVEELRDFARGRVAVLLNDLSSHGTEKPAMLSISSLPAEACSLTFNNHKLTRTTWTGQYPKSMDITLQATDRAGYTFKGWQQTTLMDVIERGSEWQYLDDGSDQGEAWRSADYDDSAWKSGVAPLGYGFSNIQTKVSYGSSSSSKHITTYFRRHFNFEKSGDIRSVKIQLCRDDAAAVYINGKRVINSNLPLEGVGYKTKALASMGSLAGKNYLVYDISLDDLSEGDNVIAVEVHQTSSSSSDLAFDLQLQKEVLETDAPMLSTTGTLQIQLEGDMGVVAMYESTGEQVLPDSIKSDMVLYKKYSPYLVSRDVVIAPEARLTIEPGVTLLFSPGAGMIVNGAMTAEGTAEDSIMFRLNPAYDESLSWGAVCFINTDNRVSSIRYAEMRDASKGPKLYNCVAAISGYKTTLRLDHLRITNTHANPITCRYGDVRVTNSVLHMDITGDMINVKYGKGYVADCEIIGNYCEDTDGIDYDGVSGGIIKRVVIHDFLGDNSDAIDLGEQAMNVLVDSVLVYDVTDKGLSVGQRSTAKVTNSTFIQTNLGLGVKDSCYAKVDHCTFYAIRTPIASYEKVTGRAGGNVVVTNSFFAGSYIQNVECDEKSTVVVNQSLSDTEELPWGTGNILADPQFTAPSIYDLTSPLKAELGGNYMPMRPDNQPLITELCYMPNTENGEVEYVMLSNVGTDDIDLTGYSFAQGINFAFPEGVLLPAGESLYVVSTQPETDTNQMLWQWDSGKLANEGETIELISQEGITVDQVSYKPTAPWPVVANGANAIVLTNRMKANHLATNWQVKQAEWTNAISDIMDIARKHGQAYDLQGRRINANSARGIIIIDGKKVMKQLCLQ